MSEVIPITRDGAMNLIRDLKAEIEEKLSVLAHMMLHERWDTQAAQARIAQLEEELRDTRITAKRQAETIMRLEANREADEEIDRYLKVLDELPSFEDIRGWPMPVKNRMVWPPIIKELRIDLYAYVNAAARNQRRAESVVRFIESGHLALAKMEAQAIVNAIKEMEYGTDEGTGPDC